MRGYWGRPEATAAKLRDWEMPGQKVLFTGDDFRTDAQGLFYYVGRQDDYEPETLRIWAPSSKFVREVASVARSSRGLKPLRGQLDKKQAFRGCT